MGPSRTKAIAYAITLGSLMLTALFLAQGVMGLSASALLPLDSGGMEASGSGRRPSAASRQRNATAILQRNIFDSLTGDVSGARTRDVVPETEVVAQPLDPNAPLPRCDGAVRLVGSLVNDRRPEWSFASITNATGKALLYREGMEVEGRTVLAIRSSTVILRPGSGNACELAMFAPPPVGGAAPPAAVAPVARVTTPDPAEGGPPAAEGAISSADMESGITRVSDTNYNVTRDLVDRLLANQAEMMRTARIIPHEEGGRTVGVKLYGIRRNSLLGRLGLQNGDMLRTINGYDMASPDSALEAYSRLRGADNLSVSVVRRGEPTTLEYNIQ